MSNIEPKFEEILAAKREYYGFTEAAIQFAAEEYTRQLLLQQCSVMLSLAFLFAQWLGEKQYTKHQVNDRWYDDGFFIGSTEDVWKLFQTDVDWIELKKANGA